MSVRCMSYSRYIKEHKIWIVVFSILLVTIELFLLTYSNSGWLMCYVLLALLSAFFLGTYVDYRRWKNYFDEVEGLMTDLDRKYLLCEMLQSGNTQEERQLKEILYQMEVSMNEQVAGYQRSSREYKEYVETWVHEIKIPIATSKLILANHKELPFGLENEIERMEHYVEQALFYARSNDVEKDYLIKRVSLQSVVQDAIRRRQKMLRGIHAKIHMYDMEAEVFSDCKWLEFMVGQIIDNSIKYGSKDNLCLEFFCEKKDNAVLFHIQDNGLGIKETEISKVFEKGFTGSNGRENANSTGIGLYLCKKLCQRLEHKIVVTSNEGEGTTVTFIFPVSKMIQLSE